MPKRYKSLSLKICRLKSTFLCQSLKTWKNKKKMLNSDRKWTGLATFSTKCLLPKRLGTRPQKKLFQTRWIQPSTSSLQAHMRSRRIFNFDSAEMTPRDSVISLAPSRISPSENYPRRDEKFQERLCTFDNRFPQSCPSKQI